MTKMQVIDKIARERLVETIVCNVAHSPLTDDLKDLSQYIYVALMRYSEDTIREMHEGGRMNYFVTRIVMNQLHGDHSHYAMNYRRPAERRAPLTEAYKMTEDD